MLLLIIFGFVAGAATAVSPCVVPVLPIALSAGVTGGRRRPLGVVTGLVVSFTFALFALVYVISALGLPNELLRDIAIVVLAVFGFILLVPPLAARVEAYGSSLGGRLGVKTDDKGDGFWGGVGLGFSLGVLYAPCAGPILAGVLTLSASQSFNAGRLAVIVAYALGSAIVLYVLMLGGRKLTPSRSPAAAAPFRGDGSRDGAHRLRHVAEPRRQVPVQRHRRPAVLADEPGGRDRKEQLGAERAGLDPPRRTEGGHRPESARIRIAAARSNRNARSKAKSRTQASKANRANRS